MLDGVQRRLLLGGVLLVCEHATQRGVCASARWTFGVQPRRRNAAQGPGTRIRVRKGKGGGEGWGRTLQVRVLHGVAEAHDEGDSDSVVTIPYEAGPIANLFQLEFSFVEDDDIEIDRILDEHSS